MAMSWWLVILVCIQGAGCGERVFPHGLTNPAFCEIISTELQSIYPHEQARCVMGDKPKVPDLLFAPPGTAV
jgi:hypothetical protein